MQPGDIIHCPNCKGKGHVIEPGSVFMSILNPVVLVISLLERNEKNGMTRERCSRCKGHGFIRVW